MKKFTKLAAVVAAAIMAFGVASADYEVPSSAIDPEDSNGTVYIFGNDVDKKTQEVKHAGLYKDLNEVKGLTAIKFTITCPQAADPEKWYGGAYGTNTSGIVDVKSGKTGWQAPQWCVNEETTQKTVATKINDTTYEVVTQVDASKLAEDDFLQAVFQRYGDFASETTWKVTLVGIDAPGAKKTDTNTETKTDDGKKATDSNAKTGDATSVVALAAVAALAMVGVVVTSKKKEA